MARDVDRLRRECQQSGHVGSSGDRMDRVGGLRRDMDRVADSGGEPENLLQFWVQGGSCGAGCVRQVLETAGPTELIETASSTNGSGSGSGEGPAAAVGLGAFLPVIFAGSAA